LKCPPDTLPVSVAAIKNPTPTTAELLLAQLTLSNAINVPRNS